MTVFKKPFALAVLVAVAFAAWAAITGGLFDGPVASKLRGSSVYAAEDYDFDRDAAAQVIGNRKLTVGFLSPGDDASEVCDDVAGAADGTLFVAMTRDGGDWSTYGCSHHDTDDIGQAMVAETVITRGTGMFVDRPVETLKVMVVNFDQLVRAGNVPDGPRTIDPPLPRYLLAGALLAAVAVGSAVAYAVARAIGKRAAGRRIEAESGDDARSVLNAETGAVSRTIIDLDKAYARAARGSATPQRNFVTRYRRLIDEYVALTREVAAAGADDLDPLVERARGLHRKATRLEDEARSVRAT
ncbi:MULTISPECIES: hypothetical protein [Prauserella salsuginis group]|uniref:Uncharacterized protein n=2 Tax=Prauserella salsuginis group TaxID=2893672 RepID=A0A839XLT5_9PSEU|nr:MULTISPECIES: hypothetical protein [Prauserella salsuginis group]MBB3661703.1 hypothetical protein [Prauserella sediminis]MCR3719612.1 hypothetical protein [Prauserella flava]MCR3735374.1 hypothetical protein [Prauserella salsuginis]